MYKVLGLTASIKVREGDVRRESGRGSEEEAHRETETDWDKLYDINPYKIYVLYLTVLLGLPAFVLVIINKYIAQM